ncbi:hypothetical protein AJ78_05612 [Emergomyces pasteurianus Ep9510]|uniref:Uncharacterized protein n=1 Tax=Emergomyces pasteurianus Ep9510 TaxID=1447872 RepID=A0A1J9QCZ4_9EURO|nr:hypothetical protein AJ78_05612 [Emergomyces pasteurianus Ep9510]
MAYLPRGRSPAITYTNDLYNRIRSRSFEIDRPRRSKLRRVVSTKGFSQYIDSSESVPSEHSSLYDAVLTSFESDDSRKKSELDGRSEEAGRSNHGPTNFEMEDTAIITPRLVYSHGKWPAKKLETIVEQKSASTLRASTAPSVGDVDGPGNNTALLTSQKPISNTPGSRNPYSQKVYSFDDLDLPPPRPKDGVSRLPTRSSSSGASFELQCLFPQRSPVEPTQPLYPPPVRSPTPPGLPSFGSREAIHYNPNHTNRTRSLPHQVPLSRGGTQQTSTEDDEDDSCCASGLKRLFGLPSCMGPRPPALPTGAVARADDGTMVRGRFGVRQSGHGVGAGPSARGLESHPFHRNSLPTSRVKDVGNVTPALADVSHQNTHGHRPASPQSAYLSPQTMPLSYSSLLRSYNAPHPAPPQRSCPNTGICTTSGTDTVPLPSYVAHRRLESPLPRAPEMIRHSNCPGGLHTPGPDGGENDGSSATPAPGQFNHTLASTESRHRQRISRQTTMIADNKAPGLWDWIFMDCFFVCCGLFDANEPPQNRTLQHPSIADGQSPTPVPVDQTANSATTTGAPIREPPTHIPDGNRVRERSPSNPWIPTWGWQPRCFGGDATMDEQIDVGTATELRLIRPKRTQATAIVNQG